MSKPRQLTKEEVREKFLRYLKGLAAYWDKVEGKTSLEKIEGAIFSTLVALDGEALDLPAFIIAPLPSKSDKKYLENEGENWFPENHESNVVCDIGGSLHDTFSKLR